MKHTFVVQNLSLFKYYFFLIPVFLQQFFSAILTQYTLCVIM